MTLFVIINNNYFIIDMCV